MENVIDMLFCVKTHFRISQISEVSSTDFAEKSG